MIPMVSVPEQDVHARHSKLQQPRKLASNDPVEVIMTYIIIYEEVMGLGPWEELNSNFGSGMTCCHVHGWMKICLR
jgi:hypothetical protein